MPIPEVITPFRIAATDEQLADLKRRLLATRWPDKEPVSDWSQGMPLAYTQQLCEYWATQYDWRAREARLNRFAQFKTTIDGLEIHFIHVRSKHADALPLLITHGWPGSIAEFHKVIEPLSDPTAHGGKAADAFHVVCPALPGYGFSGKPTEPGWSVERRSLVIRSRRSAHRMLTCLNFWQLDTLLGICFLPRRWSRWQWLELSPSMSCAVLR